MTGTLAAPEWLARRRAHEARVDAWLAPHLARRARGKAHPVEDFLFTYYSYRPGQLRRWHPGAGTAVRDARPEDFGAGYTRDSDGLVRLDTGAVLRRRRDAVEWIRRLLAATAGRAPQVGCFGLHEWAMVYRQGAEEVRHGGLPLRLGAGATAALVDELSVRCSHYDAFRFFTPAARPLNQLQPARATQHQHEQPGCLHANMDLYKWSYKLSPLAPAELVADCFELARRIRMLDMRASPYDLTGLGLAAVPVETAEGRAEYARQQRAFAEQAAVLRYRLLEVIDAVLAPRR